MRRRAGFTLVELLAVIVILSILIALVVSVVTKVWKPARMKATQAFMMTLSTACVRYQIAWGDYPPTDLQAIGGTGHNGLNTGIETLVACLSSTRGGGVKHTEEENLANIDGDSAASNLTGWYFGDNQLREYVDAWGRPLVYFHSKDYAAANPRIVKYKLSKDAEPVEVRPKVNPATGAFYGPTSFQILSVGEDGKYGTEDDLVVGR